jgi:SAM-dependent methyltransferase
MKKKISRNEDQKDKVSRRVLESYEVVGAHHAELLDGYLNNEYERPTTLALLGDVSGKKILDAGCGPGNYAELLVNRGAKVQAIDSCPKFVQLAKEKLGSRADVLQADLNEPLGFIETGAFDVVLSSLVLDYIKDWQTLFSEFNRILNANGRVIISVHHPFFLDLKIDPDQIKIEDSYFSIQQVEEDWSPAGLKIPSYRRSLSSMSSALWEAGFLIEKIVEPRPTIAWKNTYPAFYERLLKHPVFICFSAKKN